MAAHPGRNGQAWGVLIVCAMAREISAGGVVLREISGVWHVALIEPQKENSEPTKSDVKTGPAVLSLPKGLVDAGEKPEATALREVSEETGITAQVVTKLGDTKYVYTRSWGDRQRVFKIVSFYLMRYVSGEIDHLAEEMRVEVKRALWVPAVEASRLMAYSGERKLLLQAQEGLQAQGPWGELVRGKAAPSRLRKKFVAERYASEGE
jgi:8-oxo-dGTP pyrophosphatase MutT (NUDIX family)